MVRRSLARYQSAYDRIATALNRFDWLAIKNTLNF
jgi:hypothetical protein